MPRGDNAGPPGPPPPDGLPEGGPARTAAGIRGSTRARALERRVR